MEDAPTFFLTLLAQAQGVIGDTPSLDLGFWIVVSAVTFGAAWLLRRSRVTSLAIGAYAGGAIIALTPVSSWILGSEPNLYAQIGLTAGAVLLGYGFTHYGLDDLLSEDDGSFTQTILVSAAVVGMIVVLLSTQVSEETVAMFSPLIQTIFTRDISRFLWVLAPMVLIGATRE